jgi:hypothetical protein
MIAWAAPVIAAVSKTDKAFSSSGCSVRNDNPVVRLRWTDRDLTAMTAD